MSRSFRPTPALVLSILALTVAVGGGSVAIARSFRRRYGLVLSADHVTGRDLACVAHLG